MCSLAKHCWCLGKRELRLCLNPGSAGALSDAWLMEREGPGKGIRHCKLSLTVRSVQPSREFRRSELEQRPTLKQREGEVKAEGVEGL